MRLKVIFSIMLTWNMMEPNLIISRIRGYLVSWARASHVDYLKVGVNSSNIPY